LKPEYYLLTKAGREGPYEEQDLLDLLDAKQISRSHPCMQMPSGERRLVGDWFEVIEPEDLIGEDEEDDCETEEEEEEPAAEEMEDRLAQPTYLTKDPLSEAYLVSHPCWLVHLKYFAMGGGLFWLGMHYADQSPTALAGGLICGAFLAGLGVFLRLRTTYVISPISVERINGVFFKDSVEIPLQDIESATLRHHELLGFLGVGDLVFSSKNPEQEDLVFERISRMLETKAMVRRLQQQQ
jgi:hypothetical protein